MSGGIDPAALTDRVEAFAAAVGAAGADPAIWTTPPDPDALRRRARDLLCRPDAAAGPLAGRLVAVKDNVDVAGLPTTAGCPAFAYEPERSATAVVRLEAAGALVAGKTNLDQLATGLVGTRSPYGTPTNPIDPSLVPGGSSSGSAVAVALGLVDVGVTTDTAGSGRVPALATGTVGWKPPPGAVPTDGVVPACPSLDCVGAITADLAGALEVAAVLHPQGTWRPAAGALRVAVPLDAVRSLASPGMAAALDGVLARLRADGHTVVPVPFDALAAAGDLVYGGAWLAERSASVGDFLAEHPDDVDPVVRSVVLGGRALTGEQVVVDLARRAVLADEVARTIWADADVLLVPTAPEVPTLAAVAAAPIEVNERLGRFTTFANVLGLGAISVPAGLDDGGRPTGVTVLAPAGREPSLVAAAAAALGESGRHRATVAGPDEVEVAVVGLHLLGQPLHHQLADRGATLLARTATAPLYRLYRLPGEPSKPALERVGAGGHAIEVEVWSIDHEGLGRLTAEVPPPLGIGTVVLADGRSVKGFICETDGLGDALDITAHGGWRSYLAAT